MRGPNREFGYRIIIKGGGVGEGGVAGLILSHYCNAYIIII